jgi:hypothetical protein
MHNKIISESQRLGASMSLEELQRLSSTIHERKVAAHDEATMARALQTIAELPKKLHRAAMAGEVAVSVWEYGQTYAMRYDHNVDCDIDDIAWFVIEHIAQYSPMLGWVDYPTRYVRLQRHAVVIKLRDATPEDGFPVVDPVIAVPERNKLRTRRQSWLTV